MAKVSEETRQVLQGVKSEIVAGGVLFPKSDADRAWNQANDRAGRIIESYIKGEGIFQMTTTATATAKGKR